MSDEVAPFWQTKTLLDMSHQEWESVCDGCGKCCVAKLQDEETDLVAFTDIACELLDDGTCRCTDYKNRSSKVSGCIAMNPSNVNEMVKFAPPSCAYNLLLSGEPLLPWHHLLTGSRDTIHQSGNSVQYRVRYFENTNIDIDDLEDYIVDWSTLGQQV